MIKEILIDGNNFNTLNEFYNEVENKLTLGLDWKIGRNPDAFNDVLRGGFGIHDYAEPINIKWINSEKSRIDLGQSETIRYIQEKLKKCHPSNVSSIKKDLERAKNGKGEMLFDIITGIIKEHEHIELEFE